LNLCYHEDFHVAAEWNFFATLHGKSPCDGIGGTVKRLVACASIQVTVRNHILTPEDLYQWAKKYYRIYILLHNTERNQGTSSKTYGWATGC
jgi:hypothetical protein